MRAILLGTIIRSVLQRVKAAWVKGLRGYRVERTRRRLISLTADEWLNMMLKVMREHNQTLLDQQDIDGLVQLSYDSYPKGQKDAIIQRIAEHLVPD